MNSYLVYIFLCLFLNISVLGASTNSYVNCGLPQGQIKKDKCSGSISVSCSARSGAIFKKIDKNNCVNPTQNVQAVNFIRNQLITECKKSLLGSHANNQLRCENVNNPVPVKDCSAASDEPAPTNVSCHQTSTGNLISITGEIKCSLSCQTLKTYNGSCE